MVHGWLGFSSTTNISVFSFFSARMEKTRARAVYMEIGSNYFRSVQSCMFTARSGSLNFGSIHFAASSGSLNFKIFSGENSRFEPFP